MFKTIEKHPVITIILFGLIVFLPTINHLVLTIMEARNFVTAREMVQDGNWILTTLNGIPRYEKPPLPTWLSAISGILFGVNSLFAMRLPAMLMIIFSAIFIYRISLKLNFNKEVSLINSFVFMTSFYIIGITVEAPWDIYTHGFTIAAVFYTLIIFESEKTDFKATILSGLLLGLSILSKGPIGIYAIYLPFILSFLIVNKLINKSIFKKFGAFFIIITIASIIGGSWFFYVNILDGDNLNQITEHEVQNWDSYHLRPFYYYWNFFIQSGIWTILAFVSLLYPLLKDKIESLKNYKFVLLWIVLAVILLSIIPEKKTRYLVPVLYPLAINVGFYIDFLLKLNSKLLSFDKIVTKINFYFIGTITIILPIAILIYYFSSLKNHIIVFGLFFVTTLIIGYLIIKSIKVFNVKKTVYSVVLYMAALILFGLPLINIIKHNNNYDAIKNLKFEEEKQKINSYYYKEIAPELIWYYNGKIPELKNDSQTSDKFGLLVNIEKISEIENLKDNYDIKLIQQYNSNYFSKTRNRLIYNYYLLTKK